MAMNLASNGFVCFVLDHLDGSCSYAIKVDGTEVFFDPKVPFNDLKIRKE